MPDPDPSFIHAKVLLKHSYDLTQLLGSGEMGFVFLCKDLQGLKVAIKASTVSEKSRHELAMHTVVTDHPSVVSLHSHFTTSSHQYLVMDFLAGGNLLALVSKKGALPLPRARRYFSQLVSGLHYCHSLGIVHRDVKLENILLDENCENIYLTDWDLSGTWTPTGRLNKFCGSPHYAAPEVFKGIPYVGPELDVWSAGVVLFSIVCGRFPFNGASTIDIAYRVQKGELNFPAHVNDPTLVSLIHTLLLVDPIQRITVEGIMNHPFFEDPLPGLKAAGGGSHISTSSRISFAESSASTTSSPQGPPSRARSNSVNTIKNVSKVPTEESVSSTETSTVAIGVSTARSRIFESRHKINYPRGRSGTGDEDSVQSQEAPSATTVPSTRKRSHSIDTSSRHRLTGSSNSVQRPTESSRAAAGPSSSTEATTPKSLTKSFSTLRGRDRRMTVDSGSVLTAPPSPTSCSSDPPTDAQLRARNKFSLLRPKSWFKKK